MFPPFFPRQDETPELLPLQQVLSADECPVASLDLRVVPRGNAPVVQEIRLGPSHGFRGVSSVIGLQMEGLTRGHSYENMDV